MPAGDDDDDDDAMDLCYATHSAIQSGLILSYQESNRERENISMMIICGLWNHLQFLQLSYIREKLSNTISTHTHLYTHTNKL